MGLDQYAGFRDENGQVKEEFYWRKHARLQKFMAVEFNEQHKEKQKHNTMSDLQHLGFNGGQGGVKIIAIDPATRSLTQFVYPKTEKERKDFEALMGRDSTYRKQLLGVR